MSQKTKKTQEPDAPNVPAYIVTFSDMVTLLLTFFVMLLSLAQVQDPELFNKSRDAFNENINCYGLGLLTGKQLVPDFGDKKVKYQISDPDEKEAARTIDSKTETLRRLFQKAAESMDVTPSRIDVKLSDFTPTPIHFNLGQSQLNDAAKSFLGQLLTDADQQGDSMKTKVYVLGLAVNEPAGKNQWVVSALRAECVGRYLEEKGLKCPIYTWGGGPGGDWVDGYSPVSKQSQIFIAFVRNK